ncbi:hypothetical protein ACFLWI_03015 [Chloroflexota bacterium]
MKKLFVFHPFLFAIFPILFLFAYNMDEVPAIDILLPILVIITATFILFFLLRLITKSYNKIGIITSSFLILFFSYGHVQALIFSLVGEGFIASNYLWGSIWVLLFIAVAYFVIKNRSRFYTFTKFLNIVATTLIIISLVSIGIYGIKAGNLKVEEINQEGNGLSLGSSDNLPDIYYIILDGYARETTLTEIYNYDNSEFIDYLTSKGFYVASKSRSNYSWSVLSLASSLNMEHINYLSDVVGTEQRDMTVPYEMMQNNRVSRLLKHIGYRYIYIASEWAPKGIRKYADVYMPQETLFGINMTNFTRYLVKTTALAPFVYRYRFISSANARDSVLYAFDTLADIPNIKGPTFVVCHILPPHPPFVFDRNGNPTAAYFTGEESWKDKEGYIGQVIFVNNKVNALLDEILSKSDVAPVIILQGDHGPASAGQTSTAYTGLTKTEVDERMNILNAYFLPNNDNHVLYQSITPVNTFRLVFNLYFGTNYNLLEDECYYSTNEYQYKFSLVLPETNSD